MSDIGRPPSLIKLPFKYAVWSEVIREGNAVFRRSAQSFETNFVSTLRNYRNFEKLICSFSKSFIFALFSVDLKTACFWGINSPTPKDLLTLKRRVVFRSSQNSSKNYFVFPSFPGDLLLGRFLKAFNSLCSVTTSSHFCDCSLVSFEISIQFK